MNARGRQYRLERLFRSLLRGPKPEGEPVMDAAALARAEEVRAATLAKLAAYYDEQEAEWRRMAREEPWGLPGCYTPPPAEGEAFALGEEAIARLLEGALRDARAFREMTLTRLRERPSRSFLPYR